MTEGRGRLGRALHAFANVVIERARPRLLGWLRERFGPDAQLGSLEIDGRRVHILRAELPLGPMARLDVARASFEIATAGLGDAVPLRLERLEGAVVVPDPEGGPPLFEAPIVVEASTGASERHWVHGRLHVHGATWRHFHGEGEQVPLTGALEVSLTDSAWSLTDGRLDAGEARIALSARGVMGGERPVEAARITAEGARTGHYVDALLALSGRRFEQPIPLAFGSVLDGELRWEQGAGTADVTLRTDASEARLAGRYGTDGALALELDGALSWTDLWPADLSGIDASASSPLSLRARVEGTVDAPHASVTFESEVALEDGPRARLSGRGAAHGTRRLDVEIDVGCGGHDLALEGAIDAEGVDLACGGRVAPAVISAALRRWMRLDARQPLDVRGTVRGPLGGPSIALTLAAPAMTLLSEPRTREARLTDVAGRFEREGGRARFSLEARRGAGAGRIAWTDDGPLRLTADDLDPVAVAVFADAFELGHTVAPHGAHDDATWLRLPADTRVSGEVAIADGIGTGRARITTDRSDLALAPMRWTIEGADWTGSTLRGHLAVADGHTLGWFRTDLGPTTDGRVEGELALSGGGDAFVMRGPLRCAALAVGVRSRPALPPLPLEALHAEIEVRSDGMALREVEGRLFDGRVRAASDVPWGAAPREGGPAWLELTVIEVGDAGEILGRALGLSAPLPRVTLDGEVVWDSMGQWSGALTARTERSTLTLRPRGSVDDGFRASEIAGDVAMADVVLQLPPGPVGMTSEGRVRVVGLVDDQGGVALDLESKALGIFVGEESPVDLVVPLVTARAHVDAGRVLWSHIDARFYGGRASSRGVLGWRADGFSGLQATLELSDVQMGRVPLPDGSRLARFLAGRGGGRFRLLRKRGAELTIRGDAEIDDPIYPALQMASDSLSSYGLDPLRTTGTAPMRCDVVYRSERWELTDLSAETRDGRVTGELAVRVDGRLWGDATVELSARYLRTSPLLALPVAAAGDVTVPIRIAGTLAAPHTEADLVATLDGLIGKSRVGRGIQGVVDGLFGMDAPRASRRPRSGPPVRDELSLDRILDHIVDEDDQHDASLDLLLDRGLSPDRIADLVEQRRDERRR